MAFVSRSSRHRMMLKILLLLLVLGACSPVVSAGAQESRPSDVTQQLSSTGLQDLEAFQLLRELTSAAPHRLSGSPDAAKAVAAARAMMERLGFQNVHLEQVMVPHWERGAVERAEIVASTRKKSHPLAVCALGGSIATPRKGIVAEVVEVRSFEELKRLGAKAKGKIVFFNRPMDPTHVNTFEAYVGAVDQRGHGAEQAGEAGGVAALVRSMTLSPDDTPHTGAMRYKDGVMKIPTAALSIEAANILSEALTRNPRLRVRLTLDCRTLPDVPSANVVGEIVGKEYPGQVVLVSGHLDCWDKGAGAHDDGAGCVQAMEALRLLKKIGIAPRRTIRAVLFMNEENGVRGGKAYPSAPERKGETHVAALESDAGGFAPRGFRIEGDSLLLGKIGRWRDLFAPIGAERMRIGESGTDISVMAARGVPCIGLDPEGQRYFDYHHSVKDTIDKVNPRELELGAIAEALMCYLISENGL